MPRKVWECRICGHVEDSEGAMRGHVAARMETNDKYDGDHPHWDDLAVSHDDLSAWAYEVPGIQDY